MMLSAISEVVDAQWSMFSIISSLAVDGGEVAVVEMVAVETVKIANGGWNLGKKNKINIVLVHKVLRSSRIGIVWSKAYGSCE